MIDDSTEEARPKRPATNLNGRQLALHRALGELHPSLATWYEGALSVLDYVIADHLSLAAHALREIMDWLPRYIDLPVQHTTLGTKANNLREEWERLRKNTRCLQDGKWTGEIDPPMNRFLERTGDFFSWMTEERPHKTQQTAKVLLALDPIGLPAPLVEDNASSYLKIRSFFVEVAHHSECLEEEFAKWMDAFEIFLLERLVPRTYDDFDAIDRLITEGSNADA
jgi:hypothetical protein